MDFEFSPDELMVRDMLSRFIKKGVRPLEMKFYKEGTLDSEEQAKLERAVEQLGLWGATVPEEYGGFGLDMVSACVLEEELGQTFLPISIGDVPPMLYACQDEQIARFLEPALAGERRPFLAVREPDADRPEAWMTTAVLKKDGYQLNGRKIIAAQPQPNDFFLVMAKSSEGPTAFLLDVDTLGVQISSNGQNIIAFNNCQMDNLALLGEPGQALSLGAREAARAIVRLGARYVGMARRLLAMSATYAKDWVTLGAPLSDRPAVRRMLAELQVKIESTAWLVYNAAWLADKDEPLRLPAAEVRLATVDLLQRAVDLATMIHGGPGPSLQIEAQRLVKGALSAETLEAGLAYAREAVAAAVLEAEYY